MLKFFSLTSVQLAVSDIGHAAVIPTRDILKLVRKGCCHKRIAKKRTKLLFEWQCQKKVAIPEHFAAAVILITDGTGALNAVSFLRCSRCFGYPRQAFSAVK